jgi:hypothetical protein
MEQVGRDSETGMPIDRCLDCGHVAPLSQFNPEPTSLVTNEDGEVLDLVEVFAHVAGI